jgi:hypothetical protein
MSGRSGAYSTVQYSTVEQVWMDSDTWMLSLASRLGNLTVLPRYKSATSMPFHAMYEVMLECWTNMPMCQCTYGTMPESGHA